MAIAELDYANPQIVARSVQAWLTLGADQRLTMIAEAYAKGEISLGKAAELMGVSTEAMKDILRQAGIPLHLGPQTVEELEREVSAFEAG